MGLLWGIFGAKLYRGKAREGQMQAAGAGLQLRSALRDGLKEAGLIGGSDDVSLALRGLNEHAIGGEDSGATTVA